MSFWRTQHGAGIALIVLSALAFAVLDTVTKYVVTLVPVLMLLWFRYAFQALLTLVLRFPVQKQRLFSAGYCC
jgi:drug/metabolite transporter (DMT)-like permease